MDCPKPVFFWYIIKKTEQLLRANELPETSAEYRDEEFAAHECTVFPERVKEYPDPGELVYLMKKGQNWASKFENIWKTQTSEDFLGPEMSKVVHRPGIDYFRWNSMSRATKIGGYPTLIQDTMLENP